MALGVSTEAYFSFCSVTSNLSGSEYGKSYQMTTHSHPKASPLTMLQYLTF